MQNPVSERDQIPQLQMQIAFKEVLSSALTTMVHFHFSLFVFCKWLTEVTEYMAISSRASSFANCSLVSVSRRKWRNFWANEEVLKQRIFFDFSIPMRNHGKRISLHCKIGRKICSCSQCITWIISQLFSCIQKSYAARFFVHPLNGLKDDSTGKSASIIQTDKRI